MNYIDEAEIRKTIAIMKPNDELFEIRILRNNGKVFSGYFNDVDIFLGELKKQNLQRDENIMFLCYFLNLKE